MSGRKNRMNVIKSQFLKLVVINILTNVCAQYSIENVQRPNTGSNKTLELVEKIRRQLMADNYDYSDENTTTTDLFETTQTTTDDFEEEKPPDQQDKYSEPLDYYIIPPRKEKQQEADPEKPPEDHNRYITSKKLRNQPDKNNQHETKPSLYKDKKLNKHLKQSIIEPGHKYNDAEINDSELKDSFSAKRRKKKEKHHRLKNHSSEEMQAATPNSRKPSVYDAGKAIPRSLIHIPRPNIDHGFSVSQNDLLYYMDDKRMRRKGDNTDNSLNATSSSTEGDYLQDKPVLNATSTEDEDEYYRQNASTTTTPKAKYKMLKVRDQKRRMGHGPIRRFVEEKNSEGVAIFRMDAEPFPEFRLPRARRQFLLENSDNSDTDSLPKSD